MSLTDTRFTKAAASFAAHIMRYKKVSLQIPSSTPSGAPVDDNDPCLLFKRPSSLPSPDTGRIPLPQLLRVPSYQRNGVATRSKEEWATITGDAAVAMLFDLNSPVGEADLANWSDEQFHKLVEVIEPENWPVVTSKSGAFGVHTNGVDITFRNLFYRKKNVQRLNNISGIYY
jgi:hypothetical protein